jgi:hypothetical protein
MIPNNASREGTHIDPPTGAYEVYTYDRKSGTATLHLACGDDHGRAALAMRKAPGTACIARGGVVTSLASGTPANLVAGLKAAVKVAHASRTTSAAPAVTTRPVEPPAAPVAPTTTATTATPAEEPMTTTPESVKCPRPDCDEPSAGGRGCAPVLIPFCRRHRTAAMGMRSVYKLTDEEAAARCIANGSATPPPKFSASKPAAPKKAVPAPKASAKKPAAVEVNRPVSPEGSAVVVEAPVSDFATKVRAELARVEAVLLEKNAAYGNSALDPVRVFSRASTEEQLLVRIDDKLSRLARGAAAGEDVVRDLVGYLVLLLIARSAT